MAAVGHHDVAAVDDRGRGADLLEQEAVVAVLAGLLFQESPGIGRERRRNEPADVELRGFAEDDAVLVEQEDGAGRRDGYEDMARVDIHALVESDIPDRLVEHHRGIHADVEGVPGDHRTRVDLVDRHDPGSVGGDASDHAQYDTTGGSLARRLLRPRRKARQPQRKEGTSVTSK